MLPALLGCAPVMPPEPPVPRASVPLPSRPPPQADAEFARLEQRAHELINRHRVQQRLPPLAFSEEVAALAREHSRDMAAGRVPFGHGGFQARADALARMFRLSAVSENVAFNNFGRDRTVEEAVRGWIRSPGHRENLEGRFDVTGVGIVRGPDEHFFFTQLFVARR